MPVNVDDYDQGYKDGKKLPSFEETATTGLSIMFPLFENEDYERGKSDAIWGRQYNPYAEEERNCEECKTSSVPTIYPAFSGSGESSKMSVLDWVLAAVGVGFILCFVAYISVSLYNKAQSLAENNPTTILKKEIDSTLNGWVGTLVNKDIERHMNYYAHNLMPYNGLKKASISKAKLDIQEMFAKYTTLTIELTNIKIYPEGSGSKVKIVCDKNFNFQGKKDSKGSVPFTLWIEKINGSWKLTGEREG
jgi:hypothetical protein